MEKYGKYNNGHQIILKNSVTFSHCAADPGGPAV
jgi:hypothetical protein